MKQFTLITSLLFVPLFVFTQDLSKKIADDAHLMLQINGGRVLEMVSEQELENSYLFKLLIHETFRNNQEPRTLQELGLDYSAPMYLANESTKDVNFNYFTFKIKHLDNFEKLVKAQKGSGEYIESNEIKQIKYRPDERLFWNNGYALFISGDYIGSEYPYYYNGYEWGRKKEEATVQAEAPEEALPSEEMSEDEYQEYLRKREELRKKKEEARRKREEEEERKRKEIREKRAKIISEGIENRANIFFSDLKAEKGNYFDYNYDDKAVAQFWYANNILSYSNRNAHYRRPIIPMLGLGYFFGFGNAFNGSFSSRLFLDEQFIGLENAVSYPKNLQDAYAAILNQKIDKQILKLIAEDDIGYISLATSTEDILHHYPDILQETYSYFDSSRQEEFQYFSDLFNIVIDEERIAEVITGDVVFVLNNLSEKEVEYYTYEYDENYNSKRVLNTRKELLPEFSLFVGSEDESLIHKSIRIGIKREWLVAESNYYKFIDVHNEFPFELYFAYNNDLLMASTSAEKIKTYYEGKLPNKVSSDKKKIVKSNSGGLYLNLNQLFDKILSSDIRGDEREILTIIQDDIPDIYAQMNFKNGKAQINAHAVVPESNENGAKYLLDMINKIIEVEERH